MSDHSRGVVHRPGTVSRGLKLGATLAVGFSLMACSGSSGATQAAQSPAASAASTTTATAGATQAATTPAPAATASAGTGAKGAAVTLTGVLAKTYTTTDAAATKAGDVVIIAIFEPGSDTCSLSLVLPANSPPGTYKVGNSIDGNPEISALYTTLSSCSSAATEGDWVSKDGTLKITGSGTTWGGTFDVNVARRTSPAELVKVTGSFNGLNMR